jgi:septal ring factor EnvC (AmiA/AmiB activator)
VYSMGGKFLGVAIKAREGADVSNLIDGKVIYTGPHSTLGTVVFVQGDNGYIYVYGGNELSLVKTGAVVKSGEVIARLGKGTVMGSAQAFFTVWKNGNYIDPVEAPRT